MMRRIIALILFVVCFYSSFARDYYVGGTGASDNNPGTATQPFATIQKAASVAVAGDIVNIRSGTYRETIVPANSGTAGNPIIYQPDGGATVVISGLNTAEGGWSVHSGSIYKKSITLPVNGYNATTTNNTTLLANQMFKDGVMMFEARWPDLNTMDDLFDRAKVGKITNSESTSITDSSIPANVSGAVVWINGWYVTRTGRVTSQSGSTITFSPGQSNVKMREYFYLTGKLNLLNKEKEWHYENGTLYFWQVGGGTPTGIEYKARNYGFDLTNRSSVTIKGIEFIGCTPMHGNTASNNITIDGIRAKYLNHAVIQEDPDVIYRNPKQTGIKLIGANSVIKNSELQYAASQCIWLGENGVVENNLIRDISYEGNYGAGVSLWENTANQRIIRNTFSKLGRSAVDFGYVDHGSHLNVEIAYNDISDFLKMSLDGGAIYAARHGDTGGWNIHHNWIHDSGVGNAPSHTWVIGINTGIYYDQGTGPTVGGPVPITHHNVLWNLVQTDYFCQPNYAGRVPGPTLIYNNVFATRTDIGNSHSYKTPSVTPVDEQRNNIYRQDLRGALGTGTLDVANSLLENVDPQFVGTGQGGLAFRIKPTSPGVNKGVAKAGVTDGSVGVPDIGAYEIGGTDWIPGYKAVNTTTPNTPPVVSITSPPNNASFTQGSSITFSANASDADGTVTRVEFFCGTTKVGEDLTSPYSIVWNNAPIGTNPLTAKATDNQNSVTTSSPVTIIVNGNAAPTVSITGPSNNAQFTTGVPVNIAATASDANGSVTKVEFFNGTTKLGEDLSSPYSFVWNNAPAGTHALTAKATDDENSVTTSTTVAIIVNANTPPTVAITGPAANASFTTGTSITITATASDANGSVAKVEFFNGSTKLGEDVTGPYSFAWANAPAGTHTLTAKATDNLGSVTTSTTVTITVSANTAPSVLITGPSNNARFITGVPITIAATASDANGSVTKVEFFNGTTKLGEDMTSPYSFTWGSPPVGSHTIVAKATDNLVAVGTSSPVSILVVVNTPPAVSITSPSNNANFFTGSPITITANASDADGTVSKVEFFRGSTKLGEDLTSPYSFVWNNALAGNYSLVAKATDNQGAVTSSTSVSITVAVNTPPAVSLTAPTNNSSFDAGTSITISATATDATGTISKVEFYSGTSKLGQDVTSPYSFAWNNVPAGDYSITAKATDNLNAVGTSSAINISVITPVSPTANAGEDVSVTLPDNSVTLSALVAPDGPALQFSWTQVEGPSTLVIANPALQEIDLTGLIEGIYVFELTVTDSKGLSSKDTVTIIVAGATQSQELQSAIPRFFSPNDDGKGDFWEWTQVERFENSLLTVFNRSGQKIYEALSYKNTWNGKVGDAALQAGDYYYVVQLVNNTFIRGALQIIR